ncbi:tRNA (5-methylaminomethyl-2-thiouridine)(34)-methyltransferase MnmD [Shewanella sp. Scap07]|uniref:tRNA (5-methylaminomethyl-2-thiouridine)(34)-methyltransferase MnmD n=1 Tax=Shewanella sp. Scap07 TaxID=2589987 RepID=UPI0015BBCD03|nr:tRNA (5-methylaminomethyl-2-thiouridine)(34)-methyltransferase MnmD [Shewanella sp. Scap07]QLE86970.1 tRNA (5-methylaminomethyl-2-thiouridine)(34)-methyltransferase MnmD [Shewanella sp. Scap07]
MSKLNQTSAAVIDVLMTKDGSHTLMSRQFDDSYHAHNGAMSESQHVYIDAGYCALASLVEQVCILELGFGTGMNAALTLQAALKEGDLISKPIRYTSIEAYPVPLEVIAQLNYVQQWGEELQSLYLRMHQAPWDCDVEIIPGFVLHKVHGKLADYVSSHAQFNLVYYDGFAPSKQPELWTVDNFQHIWPMLTDEAMLVSYCANGQFKRNLKAAGFRVKPYPGALGRREMTRAWKGNLSIDAS